MRPLYIFDLDGTLALCDHRLPVLEDTSLPGNARWDKFYAMCDRDEPNRSVIQVFGALSSQGNDIMIFTGRSEVVRKKTEQWLQRHLYPLGPWKLPPMLMRPEHDYQPDVELKRGWYLNQLDKYNRERLVAVFEDRSRVVKMWRDLGVTCFQVKDGEY